MLVRACFIFLSAFLVQKEGSGSSRQSRTYGGWCRLRGRGSSVGCVGGKAWGR